MKRMRDLGILLTHLVATIIRVVRQGGVRSLVAESLLLKHQLLVLNRTQQRAPNLSPADRVLAGAIAAFIRPARLIRSAVVLKPRTILRFHRILVNRKYRLLFSSKRPSKPGPKGPPPELINAIVEMKQRNPRFGCTRIAQQIASTFGIEIDKDVVRRVLAKHYRPQPGSDGPSWLTFHGHTRDSLWSVDLFRCESLWLRTHWVMVVMDHFTRRIVGFAVQPDAVDGPAACRMLNEAISSAAAPPRYLSSDHDPLFEFHRWKANLRMLDVTGGKSVPFTPTSHPFVERLIGTVRREFLDQVPFWGALDLQRKLGDFQDYYNELRVHQALDGGLPDAPELHTGKQPPGMNDIRWKRCCHRLYELPAAA